MEAEAAPRVLSVEEFHQKWEPKGWNSIIIGPTSTWRQEWGEWEAIRDIVQNALDEAEGYQWGYDTEGLWISDRGRGVQVADFLLGPPKAKPDYARGKFGEGMKISALALLRKGYSVRVTTVRRVIWLVFLEQKVNGTAETLAALWRKNGSSAGTTFHIIGYRGDAFSDFFAVNLPRKSLLAEVPSPITQPRQRWNQLFRSPEEEEGRVYCRDIFLQEIISPFLYNLWGFELAPDRHGPKHESELWIDMARLWCGVKKQALMETLISMVVEPPKLKADESRHLDMDRWRMGKEPTSKKSYFDLLQENSEVWKRAWAKVVGRNTVIRTHERWDGMVIHIGYKPVTVQWGVRDALSSIVQTDKELVTKSQAKLREAKIVPDEKLSPKDYTHLLLARAISDSFSGSPPVHAAIIPPASEQVKRTAGMYDTATREILLHLETLAYASTTVDAMVHELGHHVALESVQDPMMAEDLQPAHSSAMTHVASQIVNWTAIGIYDEQLKNVVW